MRSTQGQLARALCVAATVSLAGVVPATPGVAPPVTTASIRGRWEGISVDQPRVFLVLMGGEKDSVVSMASGVPGNIGGIVYRSRSLRVSGGSFVLEAATESGDRLVASGQGRATRDWGRMDGDVTIFAPDGYSVKFPVSFMMEKDGYTNHLRALVEEADRAAAKAKEKTDGGP